MYSLKDLLESIPTNNNEDRKCAYLDCLSAIDFQSEIAMINFVKHWIDMSDTEEYYLSKADRDYRTFILNFWEKYNDHREL